MTGCFEESSEIEVVERKYIVKRHQRHKYTGTICGQITTAPGPTKLVRGGEFSIQMGVEVACDKFERHLPLERQRKEMDGQGLIVDTKTLYSLTEHVAAHLDEIPKMIKEEILGQKWVHLDESPMPFFNPSKSRGYVWTLSNNYGTFYQFEPTRSGLVAKELLGSYKGAVMTDAFGAYNFLDQWEGINHGLCWAHLRRKFFEAMNNYPKAQLVVVAIDRLFEVEHMAANIEELKLLRLKESFPIVDLIEEMINELKKNCLESSSLGKAIKYYEKGRENFRKFLIDPYVPISNNRAELSQRDAVMGRKNYQYFRSINGADTAMLFYTIIGTCKIHDVRARTYLLEMTLRAARDEALETPYQYAMNRQKQVEEQVRNGLNSIPLDP
jgi:transposase